MTAPAVVDETIEATRAAGAEFAAVLSGTVPVVFCVET
jgi:hypothetical protein